MIQGIYTALVTPFQKDHSIDITALKLLIHMQMAAGIDGITLLGTTGEGPTVDDDERELLFNTAIELGQGKINIMAGCSSNATYKAVAYARQAEALGVDSLLVSTPYYNRPTQEGIYTHFSAIADAVSLPICIYNIPSRTAQNIETSTLVRLAEKKNIICVKEASGNLVQMQDVIQSICKMRNDFTLLSGDDSLTIPALSIGGHGVISVISNIIPETVVRMIDYWKNGQLTQAQELFYMMKPLIQAAFIETNPAPIKYMLSRIGLILPTLRLPLVSVTESSKKVIEEALCKTSTLLQGAQLYAAK